MQRFSTQSALGFAGTSDGPGASTGKGLPRGKVTRIVLFLASDPRKKTRPEADAQVTSSVSWRQPASPRSNHLSWRELRGHLTHCTDFVTAPR
jgi:hypothetical protein